MDKLEAYSNNIIINGHSFNSNLDFMNKKIELTYSIDDLNEIEYTKSNSNIKVISDGGHISLRLNEPIEEDILIIRFKIDNEQKCTVGDQAITINNVKNILRCIPDNYNYGNKNYYFDYVISSNEKIEYLDIKIEKGTYLISEVSTYTISKTFFNEDETNQIIIEDKIVSDNIKGVIEVPNDGYFTFTIPYDVGYNIYVDGKKVKYEKVNYMFMGFELKKGKHIIELKFEPPFLKIGRIISVISLLFIIFSRKKG